MNTDPRRGTGRTSRMLDEAMALAATGRDVTILFHNRQMADDVRRRLIREYGPGYFRQPDPAVRITSIEREGHRFDWKRLDFLADGRRASTILIDHYAIEAHFPRLVEMLYRYELPPGTTIGPPAGIASRVATLGQRG